MVLIDMLDRLLWPVWRECSAMMFEREIGDGILIVAPHPDDEIIACAGVMMFALDMAQSVNVLVITDGAACYDSESFSSSIDKLALAKIRQEESVAAGRCIGLRRSNYIWTNLPDGRLRMPGLCGLVSKLISHCLESIKPRWVFAPSWDDNHLDHQVVAQACKVALETSGLPIGLSQYIVWNNDKHTCARFNMVHRLSPDQSKKKRAALMKFKSQIIPFESGIEPVLLAEQVDRWLSSEERFCIRLPWHPPRKPFYYSVDDLFL